MSEGGGSTTTYPYEDWTYRHLDGVGDNITIEFVDTSNSGEYHMTMDPGEKDALAKVPNAGFEDAFSNRNGVCQLQADRFNSGNGARTAPRSLTNITGAER